MKTLNPQEQNNVNFLNDKGIGFCLVQLTENILNKSIFDATTQIRDFLKSAGVHNYEHQQNGQENKVLIRTKILTFRRVIETETSLYRAGSRGDERMWFGSPIATVTTPDDIYAILEKDCEIYLVNISKINIESLWKSSVPNPVGEFITYKISHPQKKKDIQLTISENQDNNLLAPSNQRKTIEDSFKAGFVKYLRTKGMAEHSIRKYADLAPNNSNLKAIVNSECGQSSLFAIHDAETVRQIYKIVCKSAFNRTGHNMYSVAIHHYHRFLESSQYAKNLIVKKECPPKTLSHTDTSNQNNIAGRFDAMYITISEAADICGVTGTTIRNLCKEKAISYLLKGRFYFPCRADVLKYADSISQIHAIKQDINRLEFQLKHERDELRYACVETRRFLNSIKMSSHRIERISEIVHALLQQYTKDSQDGFDSRDIDLMFMMFRGDSIPEVAQKMKLTRERIRQLWSAILRKLVVAKNEIERRDEEIAQLRQTIQDLKAQIDGKFSDSVTKAWLNNTELLLTPITDLHFSIRTEHGLLYAHINTVLDLVLSKRNTIKSARYIGPKSIVEIDNWLHAHNLDYGMVLPRNLNKEQLMNYMKDLKENNKTIQS